MRCRCGIPRVVWHRFLVKHFVGLAESDGSRHDGLNDAEPGHAATGRSFFTLGSVFLFRFSHFVILSFASCRDLLTRHSLSCNILTRFILIADNANESNAVTNAAAESHGCRDDAKSRILTRLDANGSGRGT